MKLSNTALFYRMEREKAMYWLSTKKAKIIILNSFLKFPCEGES